MGVRPVFSACFSIEIPPAVFIYHDFIIHITLDSFCPSQKNNLVFVNFLNASRPTFHPDTGASR